MDKAGEKKINSYVINLLYMKITFEKFADIFWVTDIFLVLGFFLTSQTNISISESLECPSLKQILAEKTVIVENKMAY